MLKKIIVIFIASSTILLNSCGKKTVPTKTATVTPIKTIKVETPVKKVIAESEKPEADTATVVATVKEEKPTPKPADKPDFPKVISVNDDAATKSVDGRLFYDVLGHRYWKNYDDGKYYLFDKSMYNNPDFKPPK
ncbi:MAG: hypothetical protein ABI366_08425 [Ginsengibacter sp.]